MANLALPSRSELMRMFDLCGDKGLLFWRNRSDVLPRWNTKHAGKLAGSKNAKGYINVHVGDKIYCGHRIIFKIATGLEPPFIDHVDLDKSNNRPSNLREASSSDNGANTRRRRGKILPKGVVFIEATGRYFAQIRKYGQHRYLGYFDDPDSAHQAYCAAAKEMHGAYARFD